MTLAGGFHIGLNRPHQSTRHVVQRLERSALPTTGLESAGQSFAVAAIRPRAAVEHHSCSWGQEDCVGLDTGKHLLEVGGVHTQTISAASTCDAHAMCFTLGFVSYCCKLLLRQPDDLVIAARLSCIFCLRLNVQSTLATGSDNLRFQGLDIPDNDCKRGCMFPLDWASRFIQELSPEYIQQGIMRGPQKAGAKQCNCMSPSCKSGVQEPQPGCVSWGGQQSLPICLPTGQQRQ